MNAQASQDLRKALQIAWLVARFDSLVTI